MKRLISKQILLTVPVLLFCASASAESLTLRCENPTANINFPDEVLDLLPDDEKQEIQMQIDEFISKLKADKMDVIDFTINDDHRSATAIYPNVSMNEEQNQDVNEKLYFNCTATESINNVKCLVEKNENSAVDIKFEYNKYSESYYEVSTLNILNFKYSCNVKKVITLV